MHEFQILFVIYFLKHSCIKISGQVSNLHWLMMSDNRRHRINKSSSWLLRGFQNKKIKEQRQKQTFIDPISLMNFSNCNPQAGSPFSDLFYLNTICQLVNVTNHVHAFCIYVSRSQPKFLGHNMNFEYSTSLNPHLLFAHHNV